MDMDDKSLQKGTISPLILSVLAVVIAPLAFMIIYAIWPDSLARQVVGTCAVLCLFPILLFKEKYYALMLFIVFFSQFLVSLTSFNLNPPVKLLILFTDILLAFLVGVALQRRKRVRLDGLGWLFLLFLGWFAVTSFYSAHPHRSLVFFLWQFKFFILYVLASNISMSETFANRVLTLVIVILLIQGPIAVAQLINGGPVGLEIIGEFTPKNLSNYSVGDSYRSSGTIGSTSAFAGYISMLLVFLSPFLLARRSLVVWPGYVFGVIALILSLSRAGWLSFVIGFCCVVFMTFRARLVRFTRLAGILLICGLIFSLGLGLYFDKIVRRFSDRDAQQSAMGRVDQFPPAMKVIEKYPLLGIGPGVTEYFGRWSNSRIYIKKTLPDVDMSNQVHNSLLQIGIETGIPGGVIFLAIMGSVFVGVIRNVKREGEVELIQLLRIGGICAGIAVMIHTSSGTEFNAPSLFLVFWILLGLARSWPSTGAAKNLARDQKDFILLDPIRRDV